MKTPPFPAKYVGSLLRSAKIRDARRRRGFERLLFVREIAEEVW